MNASAQETSKPWSARPEVISRFKEEHSFGMFNFEESQVPDYTLPNPLVGDDGAPVATKEAWNNSRRMELLEAFRKYMYGRRPDGRYSVRFEKKAEIVDAFDGAATARDMTAVVSMGEREYSFPFVVFIPNNLEKPAPVVINLKLFHVSIEESTKEPDPAYPVWPVRKLIERGYATAAFFYKNVEPDRNELYANGIRAFLAEGQPPTLESWGCLSAWGWGASRVLDYLESEKSIDTRRAAIAGHSRLGKTALWAACEDPRFAVVFSNGSGCGGAALTRREFGETLEDTTGSTLRWYCKRLKTYAGRTKALPIDQHELMALIAPRGVYVSSADEDLWADPKGEYSSLVEAAPVFKLLGKESIMEPAMPSLNSPRVKGVTGYHIRTGVHDVTHQDWNWFLDFADTLLK